MSNLSLNVTSSGFCAPAWPETLDASLLFFQLPNLLLLLAFVFPCCCYASAECGLIVLRTLAALACGLFAAWSWLFWCRKDWVVWNGIFALANLVHLFVLCWQMRPVKFNKDLELVSPSTTEWKRFSCKLRIVERNNF
jgi:hypothetical protein